MVTEKTYNHIEEEHNVNAASEVVPYLIQLFNPATVLDVGCGIGTWLSQFKKSGSKVTGIDNPFVNENLLRQYLTKLEFLPHDLTKPFELKQRFDLVISLEVAEHLPESSATSFVESLTKHGDIIIFSAAVPYQNGQNHINEQWPEYWQDLFKTHGYIAYDFLRDTFWDNKKVDIWYKQNMIIYAKQSGQLLKNFSPAVNKLARVHPELFELRMKKLNKAKLSLNEKIINPTVQSSFRLLVRSVTNLFKK